MLYFSQVLYHLDIGLLIEYNYAFHVLIPYPRNICSIFEHSIHLPNFYVGFDEIHDCFLYASLTNVVLNRCIIIQWKLYRLAQTKDDGLTLKRVSNGMSDVSTSLTGLDHALSSLILGAMNNIFHTVVIVCDNIYFLFGNCSMLYCEHAMGIVLDG